MVSVAYIYDRRTICRWCNAELTAKTVPLLFLFALTGIVWILSLLFIYYPCLYVFLCLKKNPKTKKEKGRECGCGHGCLFEFSASVTLTSTSFHTAYWMVS